MPNKLTDTDVKKALECCMDEMGCTKGCPCFDPKAKGSHCTVSKKLELEKLTLDLINRLQAENEKFDRTVKEYAYLYDKHINTPFSHIKAEAYKECIEKVKEKSCKLNMCHNDVVVKTDYQISDESLDNLLKELVGKNESKN